MSRKVINILFIIGSCLYIPGIAMIILGYVVLFQTSLHHTYGSSSPLDGFGAFMGLLMGGAVLLVLGGTTLLVARIGALIEAAKAQEWVWFVLMVIFNWIVLLIYLLAGPKPKPEPKYEAYAYPNGAPGQPWPGYAPQTPGMTPPPAKPSPTYQPPAEHEGIPYKPQD
ncbi:MAG: hypothetical protein JOZ18_13565 [Chloroflexi bacterium]|nr:hypothetical protein [Chloroflexota bacterium]